MSGEQAATAATTAPAPARGGATRWSLLSSGVTAVFFAIVARQSVPWGDVPAALWWIAVAALAAVGARLAWRWPALAWRTPGGSLAPGIASLALTLLIVTPIATLLLL
jgi:hypothetical protein